MRQTNRVLMLLLLAAGSLATQATAEANKASIVKISGGGSQCSGVCVNPSGIILTARHCDHGATAVVEFADGRKSIAQRVYQGPGFFDGVTVYDIPGDNWPHSDIATKAPKRGDQIWLSGYPGGQWDSWRASVTGTSKHLSGEQFTMINLKTRPGWSGGPMINTSGHVVGLLSHTDANIIPALNQSSYIIDLERVQIAYTQICRDGRCFPPGQQLPPISQPLPSIEAGPLVDLGPAGETEADPDFNGVVFVLTVPEIMTGARGLFAEIVGPAAYGIPKRLIGDASGGKAQLLVISQRESAPRFKAFSEALAIPTEKPTLTAFIPKQSIGLVKGLLAKKIEREIVAKLDGILFSPVFERTSGSDYARGLAVAMAPQPLIQEQTIIERAREAALDEARKAAPSTDEIAAGVMAKLGPLLPEPIREKAETASDLWSAYERGGIALILLTLAGGLARNKWKDHKVLSALTAQLQRGAAEDNTAQVETPGPIGPGVKPA